MSLPADYPEVLDQLWVNFWPTSHVKPVPILAFIDHLFLCKQLDEEDLDKEKMADYYGNKVKGTVYRKEQQHLRWSFFQPLHWSQLYKLFNQKDGPLQIARDKAGRSRLHSVSRQVGPFFPTTGMLAKAVELINGIEVQSDERRLTMMDYLTEKAGVLKPAVHTAATVHQVRETPKRIVSVAPKKARPAKSVYVALLFLSWAGFAAYFGYSHWDRIKALAQSVVKPTPAAVEADSTAKIVTLAPAIDSSAASAIVTAKKETKVEKEVFPDETEKPVVQLVEKDTVEVDSAPTPPVLPVVEPDTVESKTEQTDTAATEEPAELGLYRIASKAYFFDRPIVSTKRENFIDASVAGAVVFRAFAERDGFVYAIIDNYNNRAFKGWLQKKDLEQVKEE